METESMPQWYIDLWLNTEKNCTKYLYNPVVNFVSEKSAKLNDWHKNEYLPQSERLSFAVPFSLIVIAIVCAPFFLIGVF